MEKAKARHQGYGVFPTLTAVKRDRGKREGREAGGGNQGSQGMPARMVGLSDRKSAGSSRTVTSASSPLKTPQQKSTDETGEREGKKTRTTRGSGAGAVPN